MIVSWFARQAAATLYLVLITAVIFEGLALETGVGLYSKVAAFMVALYVFDILCLATDIVRRIRAEQRAPKATC